jgi:predicted Zn-dependent peptidase
VDILSDLFLQSVFDLTEMDREKQVILQEISMVDDTPEECVHLLYCEHCWPDHPLGMSVLGSDHSVSALDRGKLTGYYLRHYRPENMMISAAGCVDHEELLTAFQPLFGHLEKGSSLSVQGGPTIHTGLFCHEKDLEQVHVCIGGRAPDLRSEDRLAGALLNTLLGGNMSSRLFQEVREKRGLAYAVYSFLSAYLDAGSLGVYLATDPRWVNEAVGVVRGELVRILDGDLSADELEMMREHLVRSILLGAESTDNRMMRLAKNEFVFGRYVTYEELIDHLGRVRVQDVIRVARDCFREGNGLQVTLGPVGEGDVDPVFPLVQ